MLLIAPFLAVEVWRAERRMNWRLGVRLGLLLLVGLIVLMLLLGSGGLAGAVDQRDGRSIR